MTDQDDHTKQALKSAPVGATNTYEVPELIELGSITELTAGEGTFGADGGSISRV